MPRAAHIQVRVSAEEKALIESQAKAAGLKISEFIRREAGIGRYGRADLRRLKEPKRPPAKERPDFEQRVREKMRTMPRRSAELLVKREMQREDA